jgi:hypothetical protein
MKPGEPVSSSPDSPVSPPSHLSAGQPCAHGWYDAPVPVVDLDAAPIGGLAARAAWLSRMRTKRWQFFLIDAPACVFGLAVVDTGYMGNTFAYVFNKADGRLREHNELSPLGRGVRVAAPSRRDDSFVSLARVDVRIENRPEEGRREIVGRFEATKAAPELTFKLVVHDEPAARAPMIVCWPVGRRRSAYVHKNGGMPVEGEIRIGDEIHVVSLEHGRANMDHTIGFLGYRTYWRWASGSATSDEGVRLAFDVDLVRNNGRINRNCFMWFDERIERLSEVRFDFDVPDRPWHIHSTDGRLDLQFEPRGQRVDRLETGLLAYDFTQPLGVFTGTLIDAQGHSHRLPETWGVAEEHYARW